MDLSVATYNISHMFVRKCIENILFSIHNSSMPRLIECLFFVFSILSKCTKKTEIPGWS